tara:strand:- start:839 stop:1897 length:1059 start_codon:yes stop_codon:yes gene_type:complete
MALPEDFWSNLFGSGITAGGLALGAKAYDKLGETGDKAYQEFSGYTDEGGTYVPGLADKLSGMLEFQPYTVTSATGGQFGMSQDPETGEMSYNLATSPEEQAYQQSLFGGASKLAQQATAPYDPRYEELANQAYGGVGALMSQAQKAAIDAGSMDRGAREDQVYEQLRSLQTPEEERQRLALEQRMAAQGRTGVRTAQFGGTPEQLAMAKAQAEALDRTALTAMQQSGAEQQQALQRAAGLQGLTSGMFGMGTQARMTPRQLQGVDLQNMQGMMAAGYVPQAQLLNALQPGMTAAERQRQSLSQQAGAYGETYASGLQALLQSGLGQANLAGTLGTSIAEQGVKGLLGGLFD